MSEGLFVVQQIAREGPIVDVGKARRHLASPGTRQRRSFLIASGLVVLGTLGLLSTSSSREASPVDPVSRFDGGEAFQYLLTQCSFGPRNPGSVGHLRCLQYLVNTLRGFADSVQTQPFVHINGNSRMPMANIVATFRPTETRRVVLAAHWDTRPFADQDPHPTLRNTPIPGADDGASGVAVLLEIARVCRSVGAPVGLDLVLFDGEDFGHTFDQMFLGARYFAQHLPIGRPAFAVLIDMIGQRGLAIPPDMNSVKRAPSVVQRVWQAAASLGYAQQFPTTPKYALVDDHLPLLDAGIPAIDVIDFDYPFWHTMADAPDKCTPRSLEIVGQVLLRTLTDYAQE